MYEDKFIHLSVTSHELQIYLRCQHALYANHECPQYKAIELTAVTTDHKASLSFGGTSNCFCHVIRCYDDYQQSRGAYQHIAGACPYRDNSSINRDLHNQKLVRNGDS